MATQNASSSASEALAHPTENSHGKYAGVRSIFARSAGHPWGPHHRSV